jgi:hypothetical protein
MSRNNKIVMMEKAFQIRNAYTQMEKVLAVLRLALAAMKKQEKVSWITFRERKKQGEDEEVLKKKIDEFSGKMKEVEAKELKVLSSEAQEEKEEERRVPELRSGPVVGPEREAIKQYESYEAEIADYVAKLHRIDQQLDAHKAKLDSDVQDLEELSRTKQGLIVSEFNEMYFIIKNLDSFKKRAAQNEFANNPTVQQRLATYEAKVAEVKKKLLDLSGELDKVMAEMQKDVQGEIRDDAKQDNVVRKEVEAEIQEIVALKREIGRLENMVIAHKGKSDEANFQRQLDEKRKELEALEKGETIAVQEVKAIDEAIEDERAVEYDIEKERELLARLRNILEENQNGRGVTKDKADACIAIIKDLTEYEGMIRRGKFRDLHNRISEADESARPKDTVFGWLKKHNKEVQ